MIFRMSNPEMEDAAAPVVRWLWILNTAKWWHGRSWRSFLHCCFRSAWWSGRSAAMDP